MLYESCHPLIRYYPVKGWLLLFVLLSGFSVTRDILRLSLSHWLLCEFLTKFLRFFERFLIGRSFALIHNFSLGLSRYSPLLQPVCFARVSVPTPPRSGALGHRRGSCSAYG